MAIQKALTRSELISVLREFGVATKKDLEQFSTKSDLEKLERRLIRKINASKREIMASVAQLALSTPTRKEFDKLKSAVGISSN